MLPHTSLFSETFEADIKKSYKAPVFTSLSVKMNLDALHDIPDPEGMDTDQVLAWLDARLKAIHNTAFTPAILNTFKAVELRSVPPHPFDTEGCPEWRRFFLGTLLADWASYDSPDDRADYARLKYVLTLAYKTFRLWGITRPDGQFTPVGYTGWYPISKSTYDMALRAKNIEDRGQILPARGIDPDKAEFGYVFNISIAKPLLNTSCSRKLTRAFRRDGLRYPQTKGFGLVVGIQGEKLATMTQFLDAAAQGNAGDLFVRQVP